MVAGSLSTLTNKRPLCPTLWIPSQALSQASSSLAPFVAHHPCTNRSRLPVLANQNCGSLSFVVSPDESTCLSSGASRLCGGLSFRPATQSKHHDRNGRWVASWERRSARVGSRGLLVIVTGLASSTLPFSPSWPPSISSSSPLSPNFDSRKIRAHGEHASL